MPRYRTALLAALMMGASGPAFSAAAQTSDDMAMSMQDEENINAPYNEVLATYVSQKDGINLFDYGAVTAADKKKLTDYIAALEGERPSQMTADEQIAFWANLYNAKTLDIILENYPVESIRDIKSGVFSSGPWKMKVLTVEGEELTLDNIEHDIVRAKFNEPRVHYAFNCASIGCPNLKTSAWEAETLDEDLDSGARAYIAHPRGIRIENGKIITSSIYKWFKKDFGKNDAEVLDHIRQYATGDKLKALEGKTKINGNDYDWSLNDAQ